MTGFSNIDSKSTNSDNAGAAANNRDVYTAEEQN